MGSISPDLEATSFVSPDPLGAGSISLDPKVVGFISPDLEATSSDLPILEAAGSMSPDPLGVVTVGGYRVYIPFPFLPTAICLFFLTSAHSK